MNVAISLTSSLWDIWWQRLRLWAYSYNLHHRM